MTDFFQVTRDPDDCVQSIRKDSSTQPREDESLFKESKLHRTVKNH